MNTIGTLRPILTQARYSKEKIAIQKAKSGDYKIPEKHEVMRVGQHIIEGLQEAIDFANSSVCGARATTAVWLKVE